MAVLGNDDVLIEALVCPQVDRAELALTDTHDALEQREVLRAAAAIRRTEMRTFRFPRTKGPASQPPSYRGVSERALLQ